MRIAIMGAGGLGGTIGGLLARAGEDVSFIARGAHLEAIRSRGLTIKSPRVGDFTVQVMATDDPRRGWTSRPHRVRRQAVRPGACGRRKCAR